MLKALSVNSFTDHTLAQFLDQLSSSNPTPGGGTAAALSGALAASLLQMVCRLKIGKKNYLSAAAAMRARLEQLEPLRRELLELMEQDSVAYARVMEAYQLPKANDAEKSARDNAIETALKHATDVPLRVAELCGALLSHAQFIAAEGNQNAASDAGVGALLADAGLQGAVMNVRINLAGIRDAAFAQDRRARAEPLAQNALTQTAEIQRIVQSRM
ncbi:MAG: cyclodeaminase/cyclohydrolase family protein [Chloroflexi bacterium]|nr:cyclodeaminase/cyclohydrolase family protein [Chloroflexota bacterium]